MAAIYLTLLFSFLFFVAIFALLMFLTIRKAFYNYYLKKTSQYHQYIYPLLAHYITDGDMAYQRLFCPKKKWKRDIIINILYRLASTLKNEDEIARIKYLCETIGLTKELAKKLEDQRWWVAADATHKVGRMRLDELLPLVLKNLYSQEYDLWTASARALVQMNKNHHLVHFLIEQGDKLKIWSVTRIADMLLQGGDEDIEIMLNHLDHVPYLLKSTFIEILGKRKSVKALPNIEQFLESEDQELRIKTLKAIGEIGLTTREEKILEFLSSSNWVERISSMSVVRSCGIRQAVPILIELLADSNWWVRLHAAQALYSFGSPGIKKLTWASEFHEDRYARNIASKVLQNGEFEVWLS